jgi:UDP-4-amino-4,6-dideoxy-N-acetyl-beta-L-altrosamine transaminase
LLSYFSSSQESTISLSVAFVQENLAFFYDACLTPPQLYLLPNPMIPYGRQKINQADIDAVVSVLQSDFLTQGPQVPKFEQLVASHVGAKHGLAVNSATSALHIACLALGLGQGDLLWTSPVTFVASANCALYCGAEVDFVDIDLRTYNLCPQALERKLQVAQQQGKLPKVVVPVHLCGQPCDMAAIHALSLQYGFKIIEDASHAIGGRYQGEFIGNGRFSDITVFSFHPVKIITTAEGGMAMTNSDELAHKMALLRSHGVTRDPLHMTHEPDGPWYYQQIDLGYNYRMTELQAALGLSQMTRLDDYVDRRHALALRYNTLLADLPLTLPWQHADSYSGLHLYVVRLQSVKLSMTHRQVFDALREHGIGVNLHYIPVYRHPFYQRMGFRLNDFPEAENYYAQALSLPMFQTLSEKQQDHVVTVLNKVLMS